MLTVEQRSAAPVDPMAIDLVTDEGRGIARLRVAGDASGGHTGSDTLDDAILDALDQGAPLTRSQLRIRLKVNNERLGDALVRMERQGRLVRTNAGWSLHGMPGETEAGSAGAQPAEG